MGTLLFVSIWFQSLWFLAVIGQNNWAWLLAPLVLATLILNQIKSPLPVARLTALMIIGIAIDSLNTVIGLFDFGSTFMPVWLIMLWVIFSWYTYYLYPTLKKFAAKYVITAFAISGPFSYFAGYTFNAVSLPYGTGMTMAILALQWAAVGYFVHKVMFRSREVVYS